MNYKKFLVTIIILIISSHFLYGIVEETGSLEGFLFGTEANAAYDNWESHIVEGIVSEGYNVYAPYDQQNDEFGQFTIPTEQQQADWDIAVEHFFTGNYVAAQTQLTSSGIPYDVVKFTDSNDGNKIYYMLREQLNNGYYDDNGTPEVIYDDEVGSFDFGWGLFIKKDGERNPVVITIPHPADDFLSPIISFNVFKVTDAAYYMVNGAGREVIWTDYGSYANNKSLCDPSRVEIIPFNTFYTMACDDVREEFGRIELSLQIHSYDTETHPDRRSCQMSPGSSFTPAGLPLRDFSAQHDDIVQNSDYIIFEESELGDNTRVTVKDYYSIYRTTYNSTYHDSLTVPFNVDLPGYPQNVQQNYSNTPETEWSVFSPFMHVELDELPDCYAQFEETKKLFYAFNPSTETWYLNQRYDNAITYYAPFVEAFNETLQSWYDMDDGEIPETPTNVSVFFGGAGSSITWTKAPCYDFETYEVLLSTSPISEGGYDILDVNNGSPGSHLAYPLATNYTFEDLELSQTYYSAVRVRDFSGNLSEISNQVTFTTLPIVTSSFVVTANQETVYIDWTMIDQDNSEGFDIYRSTSGSDYELYISYLDLPLLDIVQDSYQYFSYSDDNLELGTEYSYQVRLVSTSGDTNIVSQNMDITLTDYIEITATSSGETSLFKLGKNFLASDGYDTEYDMIKHSGNYQFNIASIVETNKCEALVIGEFPASEEFKEIILTKEYNVSDIEFSVDDYDFSRNSEKLYLKYDGNLYIISDNPVSVAFEPNTVEEFSLFWGNLQPIVTPIQESGEVVVGSSSYEFNWSIDYPILVDHYDIFLRNETDSILVVEGLSGSEENFIYNHTYENEIRFINGYVRVYSVDGEINDYALPNEFAFVADLDEMVFIAESNQLISYPYSDAFDTALFGISSIAYILNGESSFEEADYINSNSGYLIDVVESDNLPFNGDVSTADSQFPINRGWNLVHNPHPVGYNIKDLEFIVNNSIRSYEDVVENSVITSTVHGIRDGSYVEIDSLKAYESCLIYQINVNQSFIRFRPMNHNEAYDVDVADTVVLLEFTTATGASDQLTIGTDTEVEAVIDDYLDAVEPPLRPTSGISEAYIVTEEPLNQFFPKLDKKIKQPQADGVITWDIAFTNSTEDLTNVRIISSNLPDDRELFITFNEQSILLDNTDLALNTNGESGTFYATLSLAPAGTSNSQDVINISQLSLYPNPSAGKVNLTVSNTRGKDFNISVYNIRGQKVKDFNINDCKDVNSNITWNGRNNSNKPVSSGVYFVRYKDKTRTTTSKICIMK